MRTHRFPQLLLARVLCVAIACTSFVALAQAESPPYQARVATAGASVRSGPGDSFYVTESLAEDQLVDVYREEPNGWLAIRPPDESFSWIYGKNLKPLDGGLAEVTKDNVASRIGSRLGSKRNAVQIRLKKGEVVQIIGEESVDDQTWYKIAPPSGEFRWINASSVRHINGAPIKSPVVHAILTSPIASQTTVEEGAVRPASESEPAPRDNWRAAATPLVDVAAPPLASASATPPPAAPPAAPSTPPANVGASSPSAAKTQAVAAPLPSAAPSPSVTAPPEGFARQVADLDLRLSRMIADPPAAWNIDALQREAQQLLSQAPTAQDRDAVQATLAKIDRFNTISQRHRQTAVNATTPVGSPVAPGTAVTSPAEAAGYDAVGILRPVVSKRPGAPQFALVDERGQVVSFVTATPDMNLQPYIGHRIAIAGNRGFIPEFRRAHVVASRVTPLAERTIR